MTQNTEEEIKSIKEACKINQKEQNKLGLTISLSEYIRFQLL